MRDPIKQALTRKTIHKETGGKRIVTETPPNPSLLLGVKFAITMTACLSLLEVAYMILLKTWNSEIFAAITGLMGTLSGILISQKT